MVVQVAAGTNTRMKGSQGPYKGKSPLRLSIERFFRNRLAVFGLVILLLIIFVTVAAPLFTRYSPSAADIMNTDAPPSPQHWLGTDGSGYDLFSRLLYGGRVDLSIAFAAAFMTMFIGTLYGGIAGYFGGWIDNLLMRFVDVMLNFPFISLVLVLEAILNTSSAWMLVIVVGLTAWPGAARMMRGMFLQLREQDYVIGAMTVGASRLRVIFRHMLPNSLSLLVVLGSFSVANFVGINAALSVIGLGVPLTVASWGTMLANHSNYLDLKTEVYAWMPPALMIILTILSVNFIGDGLRDAFDPQTRG